MRSLTTALLLACCVSCQVNYSLSGGQFSGAKTFTVAFFTPKTSLATTNYAQQFTESLKDVLLVQSPLKLAEQDGDLQFEGAITDYRVVPVAIQGGETELASLNRLTITVQVKYTNTFEKDLGFNRTFSKFADFPADSDLFSVEEALWKEINELLVQEIYNASVGNW